VPEYIPPPSTLPPGSVVWAYLRDSGGPNQDRSVEQQRDVLTDYCFKHGLDLAQIFADIHKSGTSDDRRDQFRELIERTNHEKPAGLLIWSFARFARSEIDSQYYKALLRKKGIVIHSLIDDIPEGKFQLVFEALIDVSDQEKAEQISWEASRGLHDIVKNNGAMPGTPPKGFKRQPITVISREGIERTLHRWVPDPDVIPIVQLAFTMRIEGKSLHEINTATHLFNSLNGYSTFWKNKLYIGILEYGDLTIEDYCEPVIDKATWNAVQLLSEKYAKHGNLHDPRLHPRRVNSSFLLSGLCHCSRCGSPMWGQTSPQRTGKKIINYRCTGAARRRDCKMPCVPAKALEQAVIDKLAEEFSDPRIYVSIQKEAYRQRINWQEKQASHRKDLEKQMRSLKRQADNIANAIADTGHSKTLLDRLTLIELDQQGLQLKLNQLERATAPIRFSAPKSETEAERLAKIFKSKDMDAIRTVVHGLVLRVDVDREGKNIRGLITIGIDTENPTAMNGQDPLAPRNPPGGLDDIIDLSPAVRLSRATSGVPGHTHSIVLDFSLDKKHRS
jgi:site-specific DNA recombinase